MQKTHAMRVLDARGIAYEAKTYDAAGAFHSAEDAAALLGVPAASVYKTLVVLRDAPRAKPLLVMVEASAQVDLKALAQDIGEKRLRMASLRDAEQLTGMQVGGISALGLREPAKFDVCIDETARFVAAVHLSAGVRGVDLALDTVDLIAVVNARFVRAT